MEGDLEMFNRNLETALVKDNDRQRAKIAAMQTRITQLEHELRGALAESMQRTRRAQIAEREIARLREQEQLAIRHALTIMRLREQNADLLAALRSAVAIVDDIAASDYHHAVAKQGHTAIDRVAAEGAQCKGPSRIVMKSHNNAPGQ